MMRVILFCIVLFFVAAPKVIAQSRDSAVHGYIYRVSFKNGSAITGWVDSTTPASVYFRSTDGRAQAIERSQVEEIRRYRGSQRKRGDFVKDDPMHDVLFSAQTGETLDAGEFYIGDADILVPFISIGITNWLTASFGTFLLNPDHGLVYEASLKARLYRTENFSLSLSETYTKFDPESIKSVSLPMVSATVGSLAKFTAGFGVFTDFNDYGITTFMVGADIPFSQKVRLVTENWIVNDDRVVGVEMLGIRYVFSDHFIAQAAVLHVPAEISDFPFLPMISASYHFGVGESVESVPVP